MLRHLKNQKQTKKKSTISRRRDNKGRKLKATNKDSYEEKRQLETLEPDLELPQGYLSCSQCTMYLRCGKQYQFRYIDKIKSPPAVALTEGKCHHTAFELDNNSKYKTGEPLGVIEVLDTFADGFRDQSREISKIEWRYSGETLDTVIDRGRILVTHYMSNYSKLLIPSDRPEKKFEIELGGVPFIGFIDLPMKKSTLDYKVVKKAKSQSNADLDLQGTVYSLVQNKKVFEFLCLCKTTIPKIVRVTSQRSLRDYVIAEAIIEGVAEGIKKGNFPMCNPADNYLCSPKFCGYWNKCIGSY